MRAGAAWLDGARLLGEADRGTIHEGLLPEGYGEALLAWGYVLYHDYWGVLGLEMASRAATALGHTADGTRFASAREELRAAVLEAVDAAIVESDGERWIAAAPGVPESRVWGTIAALYPCEVLDAHDPRMSDTLEAMWTRRTFDLYRFFDTPKVWTYITADWAQALLVRGEWERAATLLAGFRAQASPVFGYWEEIYVETGKGTGDSPHGWAAAQLVLWLRAMLVRETPDGLELLGGVPPSWRVSGAPLIVERLPTSAGVIDLLRLDTADDGTLTLALDVTPRRPGPLGLRVLIRGAKALEASCDVPAATKGGSLELAGVVTARCTISVVE